MDPKLVLDAATKLGGIVTSLGMLDSIKKKLVKQPDAAAAKLAAVLEELQKTLLTFESEVVPFLSINLGPGPDFRADLATLYRLEGQSLWARTNAARGHCGKIGNIYDNYLDPWFQRVVGLTDDETGTLSTVFDELKNTDGVMVDLLNKATAWLAAAAQQVTELFEQGKVAEANMAIAKYRVEILPVRRALAKTLGSLFELEADFLAASGVS
jgi:ferritin-like metal-binding protein YciE